MGWSLCQGGNGSSGGETPIFSKTTILDNSSEATTFTFASDYHDYDILCFRTHNVDSGVYQYYYCTPNAIDYAFTLASRVTFNQFNTNQYATYSQSGLTWTRTHARSVHVVECVGFICMNMVVTETEIYKAQSLTPYSTTVTYNDGLINEFDLIFVWANSDDYTEILPCASIIHGVDFEFENEMVYTSLNYYNGNVVVSVTDTTMSSFRYFYVSGIKFT